MTWNLVQNLVNQLFSFSWGCFVSALLANTVGNIFVARRHSMANPINRRVLNSSWQSFNMKKSSRALMNPDPLRWWVHTAHLHLCTGVYPPNPWVLVVPQTGTSPTSRILSLGTATYSTLDGMDQKFSFLTSRAKSTVTVQFFCLRTLSQREGDNARRLLLAVGLTEFVDFCILHLCKIDVNVLYAFAGEWGSWSYTSSHTSLSFFWILCEIDPTFSNKHKPNMEDRLRTMCVQESTHARISFPRTYTGIVLGRRWIFARAHGVRRISTECHSTEHDAVPAGRQCSRVSRGTHLHQCHHGDCNSAASRFETTFRSNRMCAHCLCVCVFSWTSLDYQNHTQVNVGI